jgi:hypothetical protein
VGQAECGALSNVRSQSDGQAIKIGRFRHSNSRTVRTLEAFAVTRSGRAGASRAVVVTRPGCAGH